MFKRKLYVVIGALLTVALMAGGMSAFAQDGPQTFTSADGTITFEYPAGWVGEEFFGMIVLANSQEALDAILGDAERIESGQALVIVATPEAMATDGAMFGYTPEMPLEDVVNGYAVNVVGLEDVSEPESGSAGDHAIAYVEATMDAGEVRVYGVQLDEGAVGMAVLATAAGELDASVADAESIVRSMTYQAPPEASETASLVWQQTQPIDYETDDGYTWIDGLTVGPDDTIYVLDGNVGIRAFSPDGEPQGIISPGDPFWGVTAFDVAPDGTFWGMDNRGVVGHFDADGTVLSSFDVTTTEIGEPSFTGLHVLIGPDGNLYIVNPRNGDDDTATGVLYVVTTEGEVLRSFELGTQDYSFDAFLDFGPDGNLYVVNIYDNTGITVYDTEGNVLNEGIGRAALSRVFVIGGLAVGADGSLYVADSSSPIYHLASDGTLLGKFGESYYLTDTGGDESPVFPEGTFGNISAVGVLSDGDAIVGDSTSDWWQLVRVHFSE